MVDVRDEETGPSNVLVSAVLARSILNPTTLPAGDYSANPYVGCPHRCRYCYASFMKRFTRHPEPWGDFLDVKEWTPLRRVEKYRGKRVLLGTVCDPYNPWEEQFGRTRTLLEELLGSGAMITVLTKSDLILRDADLLARFPGLTAVFSINTLSEEFRKDMDRAPSIVRRLTALKALHDRGIRTACFISPIFPGLSDVIAVMEAVEDAVDEVWLENLNLRGSYRLDVLEYIRERHPDLVPLYHQIYTIGDGTYWEDLGDMAEQYAGERGIAIRNYCNHKRGAHEKGARRERGQCGPLTGGGPAAKRAKRTALLR